MKPSIIFFDYGNVICTDPTAKLRDYLAQKFQLEPKVVGSILSEECGFLDSDVISEETFWKRVIKRAGYAGNPAEFETTIQDIYYPNIAPDQRVLHVVEKVKNTGIRTGILSNTSKRLGNYCRNNQHYAGFEPVILSFELGIRKPEPLIFYYALEAAGIPANDASTAGFVDDKQPNLEAARACGLRAVHFDISTSSQPDKDLEAILCSERLLIS